MPSSKPRLQVVLSPELAAQVKQLAQERGVSVSSICSELISAAMELDEFSSIASDQGEYVDDASKGVFISEEKLKRMLQILGGTNQ